MSLVRILEEYLGHSGVRSSPEDYEKIFLYGDAVLNQCLPHKTSIDLALMCLEKIALTTGKHSGILRLILHIIASSVYDQYRVDRKYTSKYMEYDLLSAYFQELDKQKIKSETIEASKSLDFYKSNEFVSTKVYTY